MSLELNPNLKKLPVYQPGRPIEEVARELGMPAKDIIKLASNENPNGPSPAAMAAMERVIRNLHLYPDGNAFYLKKKLAEKLGVAPENLVLGNGSNEIIEFIGHALMAPGTEVIVSQYCFAVYPIITHLFGARLVTVPAKGLGHDLTGMLQAITPATRVVFVANPNNPTGTLLSAPEILEFVEKVPAHVLIAMDEAYLEFLPDPCDLLPLVRQRSKLNLILMRTFSKIYGLAGLRLGYGIGDPELIASLEKVRQPFNINSLVQAGAIAALDDLDHLNRTREVNLDGLRFFETELEKQGLPFQRSAANFILVKVGQGQRIFELMQQQGVITRPMGGYQLPDYIRISIGTSSENQRGLGALKKAVEQLAHKS